MQSLFKIFSDRWPICIVALLLVSLWGSLSLNSPDTTTDIVSVESGSQTELSYNQVLPNILAPVIRKEVRKDPVAEQQSIATGHLKFPDILSLFQVKH